MQDEVADQIAERCGSGGARLLDYGFGECLVGEAEGSPKGIGDELFGEASHERAFVFQEFVTESVESFEGRSIRQCSVRVDGVIHAFTDGVSGSNLGIFLSAPEAYGIEVFESESDGINLSVALGALRFLHVRGEEFSGG